MFIFQRTINLEVLHKVSEPKFLLLCSKSEFLYEFSYNFNSIEFYIIFLNEIGTFYPALKSRNLP